LKQFIELLTTYGLSRFGQDERIELYGCILGFLITGTRPTHGDDVLKHRLIQQFAHPGATRDALLNPAGIGPHKFEKTDIFLGQLKMKIIVPYERFVIDVHLKMIMRLFGMLATAFMPTQVIRTTRE
jgi:hypothetical protein